MLKKEIIKFSNKIVIFLLLIIFALIGLAKNTQKSEIKINFNISDCLTTNGRLVVKGNVVLENNTDLPLFFKGKTLAENVDFIVVNNIIGNHYISNGARLKSITAIETQAGNTYGLKVMPYEILESDFLTSFEGDIDGALIKHIKCQIRIDSDYYYSKTEILKLK